MKTAFKPLVLSALLLVPGSAAYAEEPSVGTISDLTVNAGSTVTVNVVAVDPDGDAITLTSSLPGFATLNAPTTGTGLVVTSLTVSPSAGDVGTHSASITASAAEQTDTEEFQITVAETGTNQAPLVTAPAHVTIEEGALLTFTVTANDPDADEITSLSASGLPTGAGFNTDASHTSGIFTWTPGDGQAGFHVVVFTASNAQSGSATTVIEVIEAEEENADPEVDAPSSRTVTEGQTLTFTVTATDDDGDHVTLTASDLPPGAAFNDNGDNTGTFTWTPGSTQSGTYTVTFTGTDGQGGSDDDETTITVLDAGEGEVAATARMVGNFNEHRKSICFHIRPVDDSFDLRLVSLSGIMLSFHGSTRTAVTGRTHLGFDCDDEECEACDGEDDGDECDECENDDEDCDECDHVDECDNDCEPELLMACFSMSDIRDLFGDAPLPVSFLEATIEGTLTTGQTFVATIEPKHIVRGDHGKGKGPLHLKVRPNPLNPKTDVTFTLTRAGRVRVAVYDLQGRLVRTLVDRGMSAGEHAVPWDGSDARNARVASGAYFVRVLAPQGEGVQRIAVVR